MEGQTKRGGIGKGGGELVLVFAAVRLTFGLLVASLLEAPGTGRCCRGLECHTYNGLSLKIGLQLGRGGADSEPSD